MKSVQIPGNPRPRCPVCGSAVYSAAGIHPQCAVKVAEAPPPRKPTGAAASASNRVDASAETSKPAR